MKVLIQEFILETKLLILVQNSLPKLNFEKLEGSYFRNLIFKN